MIFFNPTLMPTPETALLFMVHNPLPLANYGDHEAALYIQLHELITQSLAEGKDPIMLIEEYLEVYYNDGHTPEEIAAFLIQQDKMVQALALLRDNWKTYSPDIEPESIAYGGLSKQGYLEQYGQLNFRSYIETLSNLE